MNLFKPCKGFFVVAFSIWLLQGCSDSVPVFFSEGKPVRLSDWRLLTINNGRLVVNPHTLRYKPASPLFSDYAKKLRTMWIPEGKMAAVVANEIEFPIGTILSKTFYYPINSEGKFLKGDSFKQHAGQEKDFLDLQDHKLLETRLLIRREGGWDAFPYVWNDEQTEAFLRVAGATIPSVLASTEGEVSFNYFVPNENQCSGCHTTVHPDGGMHPLGAVLGQLNHEIEISNQQQEKQLAIMAERGWLSPGNKSGSEPSQVLDSASILSTAWEDETLPVNDRALAYLNIQCGHCHNPQGAADTSALLLDGLHSGVEMGVCKPPVAAGGGSGNLQFSIVPGEPDESILIFRMMSENPAVMMPELGRSLVHTEGVDLVRRWIETMTGSCN